MLRVLRWLEPILSAMSDKTVTAAFGLICRLAWITRLHQVETSEFCAKKLYILRAIFVTYVQHFNPFFYGKIVCDNGILSRVSWLVGPLKLELNLHLVLDCWKCCSPPCQLITKHSKLEQVTIYKLTAGSPALGRIEQIYFLYLSTDNHKFKWHHVKNVYCLHLWKTKGQSNLTKSASRGAHSPVRGHPRGSKVVPLNSCGRVSY